MCEHAGSRDRGEDSLGCRLGQLLLQGSGPQGPADRSLPETVRTTPYGGYLSHLSRAHT